MILYEIVKVLRLFVIFIVRFKFLFFIQALSCSSIFNNPNTTNTNSEATK